MGMGASKKHHYVPAFYLKRWAGEDGRVCRFVKAFDGRVHRRYLYPDATGYVDRLYELKGLPPELAQRVETEFFSPADNVACDALDRMYRGGRMVWTPAERSGWSRFLMSLMLRTPEDVQRLKDRVVTEFKQTSPELNARYASFRTDAHPGTLAEYLAQTEPEYLDRGSMRVLTKLIDNPRVGQVINHMNWNVLGTDQAAYELLTSDRAVIGEYGLSTPRGFIMLPIGPRKLFLAYNDSATLNEFLALRTDELVLRVNDSVVRYAVKFVWGRDERQMRFVQNRMSTVSAPLLLDLAAELRKRGKSR
jgi:hypothetical protein